MASPIKPDSERKKTADGRVKWPYRDRRVQRADWYKRNRAQIFAKNRECCARNPGVFSKGSRKKWLKDAYGLTVAQFESMSVAQDGRCCICGRRRKLCVDHCHVAGDVRGLLCRQCNAGIGYLDDNPGLLLEGVRYIRGERGPIPGLLSCMG